MTVPGPGYGDPESRYGMISKPWAYRHPNRVAVLARYGLTARACKEHRNE